MQMSASRETASEVKIQWKKCPNFITKSLCPNSDSIPGRIFWRRVTQTQAKFLTSAFNMRGSHPSL